MTINGEINFIPSVFTHVVTYNDGSNPKALTFREARSFRQSMKNGECPEIQFIYTRLQLERRFVSADNTYREWSNLQSEFQTRRALALANYYGDLLSVIDQAECHLTTL